MKLEPGAHTYQCWQSRERNRVGRAQRDDAAVASRGVLVLQLRACIVPVRAPPTAATAAGKPHGCAETHG